MSAGAHVGAPPIVMPWRGFEPRRLSALPPQDSVSTSFTTRACGGKIAAGRGRVNGSEQAHTDAERTVLDLGPVERDDDFIAVLRLRSPSGGISAVAMVRHVRRGHDVVAALDDHDHLIAAPAERVPLVIRDPDRDVD